MKVLVDVPPTAEQLPIISNPQAGVTVIRGSAGSGKTTTALLMLKQLSEFWLRHRERNDDPNPVQILVLTYNRTLRGYIAHLAKQQITSHSQVRINVSTFGKWSHELTQINNIIDYRLQKEKLIELNGGLQLPEDFLCDEVEYCLGRFHPNDRDKYLTVKREGRGITPRMERATRERFVNEVIVPYEKFKRKKALEDWNDLALELINSPKDLKYDVIIADETQDFSANQLRAVKQHAADQCTMVFVIDTAQQIYPRGWNWREFGITFNPNRSFRLKENHRNTIEICRLAKPLLEGLDLSDDGTIPDLDSCFRNGPKPQLLKGRYSAQCSYAISEIKCINLNEESVAFAHPKAGRWFDCLRGELKKNGLNFVELTRQSEWPQGHDNIALISMHSAKGLEFDHIYILGLNEEITQHGNEDGDTSWENLRRLFAMTITRARMTVTLGCKPDDPSSLLDCLTADTYKDIIL